MTFKKNLKQKVTWFTIFLLILSLPWFADLSLLFYGSKGRTLGAFIEPSFDEVLISASILIIFNAIAFFTALFICRPINSFQSFQNIVSNNSIEAACFSLLPIFFFLNLFFLSNALQDGIVNVLLAFRSQSEKIGFLGYFVIIFCPIVLSVTWRFNKNLLNYSFLILISATNLLTGFRVLLINGLIFILIYNHQHFLRSSFKKISLITIFFVTSLLIYEFFRAGLESGDVLFGDDDRSVFDSLARSVPIRYMSIALRENLTLNWSVLVKLLVEPFSVVLSQIFPNTVIESASLLVSEPMVRSYLIWRGTPFDESTGFSVHVLAQSFLFDGVLGVALFSCLIGLFLGIGVRLVRVQSSLNRLLGTILLTFVVSCSEAFSEAWKLLCYWMIFLVILIFYARIISLIKPRKN